MNVMTKWDERFMEVAKLVASWSKDPSTQVGCVLVNEDRHIISTGYNGFPRGVSDCCGRYNHRPTKYEMVQHAEMNAITQAVSSTKGCTAYVTHFPCSTCMGLLINSGIKKVVTTTPDKGLSERFELSFRVSRTMAHEAKIELVET